MSETPLHPILTTVLRGSDEPVAKAQASAVAKATATLSAAARAIVAASPSPVAKDAAPEPTAPAAPQTGPRYVERAPVRARAEPGTAEAVFQGAVRQVPEPEDSDAAAAFNHARALRERGVYGTPITGGSHR